MIIEGGNDALRLDINVDKNNEGNFRYIFTVKGHDQGYSGTDSKDRLRIDVVPSAI